MTSARDMLTPEARAAFEAKAKQAMQRNGVPTPGPHSEPVHIRGRHPMPEADRARRLVDAAELRPRRMRLRVGLNDMARRVGLGAATLSYHERGIALVGEDMHARIVAALDEIEGDRSVKRDNVVAIPRATLDRWAAMLHQGRTIEVRMEIDAESRA